MDDAPDMAEHPFDITACDGKIALVLRPSEAPGGAVWIASLDPAEAAFLGAELMEAARDA